MHDLLHAGGIEAVGVGAKFRIGDIDPLDAAVAVALPVVLHLAAA
jgi:hypothetical protein